MPKTYLSVDSQILNGIQACSMKAKFQFIEHLQPQTKAVALEKGDLLHKCLEIYDGIRGRCVKLESDTWIEVQESFGSVSDIEPIYNLSHKDVVKFACEAGRFFASKMDLNTELSSEVIYQFTEYCEHYEHDPWSTLAVEEIASKIMYEDDDLQIIYTGKIDRVVEQGRIRAPMDHKSSSQRSDPTTLSNQFIGYPWLLGMQQIIVDKVGFQKTLKRQERFQRYVLTIDALRQQEWVNNSIYWIKKFHQESILGGHFPMNLTSCDKYGSCIYSKICEINPEGRNWKKESEFVVGQKWDPGKSLEN